MNNGRGTDRTTPVRWTAEVQEALQALAENLAQAEPLVQYRQAQAALEDDRTAVALLQRLSASQADLRTRQTRGAVSQTDIAGLRQLQDEVQSNRTIMGYAVAQRAAMAYLPDVNAEISQLLGIDFVALAGGGELLTC